MAANTVRLRATLDDQVSSRLDRIRDGFDRLGKSKGAQALLEGIGVGAGIAAINGLSMAADRARQFLSDSVDAASSLQQSVGAVQSVFGPASAKIEAFGKTAADSMGLSRREVNELGSVLGAQLKGMGFSLDQAADQTQLLEQRGADLAATFGGKTSDAVSAMSALLRGERDPIERYGVSIKEVDVQARIAALGLDVSTAAAKKQATAIASLDLLFEQTSSSAGQFARESDSLAGAQQRLDARVENLQARVGGVLVPVLEDATGAAIDFADAIDKATDDSAGLEDRLGGVNDLMQIFTNVTNPGSAALGEYIGKAQQADQHVEALGVSFGRTTSSLSRHSLALQGAAAKSGDLEAASRAAAAEQRSLEDAVNGANNELFRTEDAADVAAVKLYQLGAINLTTLRKRLNEVGRYINDINVDLRTMLDLLTRANSQGGFGEGRNGNTIGGKAGGGWVGLNGPELNWNGEDGPEYIVSNDDLRKGGASVPGGAGGAGNAAPVTLQIVMDGRKVAEVVDERLYYMLQRAAPTAGRA